ncbi:MAG: hypothetical protein ACOCR0_02055 [Haloferacaceae archaeon]
MSIETTVTIAPNGKYDEVIRGELVTDDDTPTTEEVYKKAAEYSEAANQYLELKHEASEAAEEYVDDPEGLPTVSWHDLSVSSDADLVAKMATYFDGVSPDEPTDLIRAKLRLLDVDVYIDAQAAATAELRG